ncbi:MAG: hypothetical protein LC780_15695 [Acidobacteria bacterium]|nr:hypothetical protein [Acidobacteriota bacterium]
MTLSSGFRLGSYEIVAPLGAGGMGEVYRARDARLGREVAIKVLPEGHGIRTRSPDSNARRAPWRRFRTPTSSGLHHFDRKDGTALAVLELLSGRTFRSRGASPRPTEGDRHRDIKRSRRTGSKASGPPIMRASSWSLAVRTAARTMPTENVALDPSEGRRSIESAVRENGAPAAIRTRDL